MRQEKRMKQVIVGLRERDRSRRKWMNEEKERKHREDQEKSEPRRR